MKAIRIAIDGDAGAGKTVTGREVAARLGYLFLDTGAMYRTLGLLALRLDVSLEDQDALADLLKTNDIELRPPSRQDGRSYDVLLNQEDVTHAIRTAAVDDAASRVAVHSAVRRRMVELQRAHGLRGRVVMVGRDIGTVVMPQAELKLYLTASLEERVRRRTAELAATGFSGESERIRREIVERDSRDISRVASPLRVADGGVVLSTDGKSIEDVVGEVLVYVNQGGGSAERTPPVG